MLQRWGLLPLLESEREALFVLSGYGLRQGQHFLPGSWEGKKDRRGKQCKAPRCWHLTPELVGEITYYILSKASTSATQHSHFMECTVKSESGTPYGLKEKKAGSLARFSVTLCYSMWIEQHCLDKPVNTDSSSFKAGRNNARRTWPQKECT